MRTLMILQTAFPPDIRLEKEISALNTKNVEVVLLARQKKSTPIAYGARAEILPVVSGSSRIAKIFSLPLFFSPLWLVKIIITIYKYKINVLHVHDLPLAPLVITTGRLLRIPVIYDMHENYPAMLEMTTRSKSLFKYYLTRNYHVAKLMEKYSMRYASALIYVAEEFLHLIPAWRLKSSKVVLVSNTEEVSESPPEITKNPDDNRIRFCFIGGFGPSRPLGPFIEALSDSKMQFEYELNIVGKGEIREVERLKKLVVNLGQEHNIHFISWLPLNEIWEYIDSADICLLPQLKNQHSDYVLPHKLFQYLKRGKPVIVGNCNPLIRNVRDGNCGFIVDYSDKNSISELFQVIKQADLTVLGMNGYKWVKERYPWENDKNRLLRLYQEF